MHRRLFLGAAAGALVPPAAASAQARVYDMETRRNPGCGCCHLWVRHAEQTGRFRVAMSEDGDLAAFKRSHGVPEDLASCHTSLVGGYVIEGHVPAADVLRLLETRPRGVVGLAVAGMPLGSPGMETPSGAVQAYVVMALHRDGARSVFARHGAAQHH